MRIETNELSHVIELNEGAKTILDDTHQVNLRALDAIVRSHHGGNELRGFAEVSSQMRHWSLELHGAVRNICELSAQQVRGVSAFVHQRRMFGLLSAAARGARVCVALNQASARMSDDVERAGSDVQRLKRRLASALEDLEQLGLMASVLARAAAIEASSGNEAQRDALSAVSREFAERSESVTEKIRAMVKLEREARS